MQRLILFLFSTLSLPLFVLYSLFKPRLKSTLVERLGFGDWSDFKHSKSKLLWIHAASLGEVNGVIPIIKKLKTILPEIEIIGTTTSDTGKSALLKHLDTVLILPFDHPWLVAKALNRVKPDLIAISETEIWPSFILAAQKKKIPVIYFNARISDYTFGNYKRIAAFLRPILSSVNLLYAQTQTDLQRFSELGVKSCRLAGNTKSDFAEILAVDREQIRNSFGFKDDDLCLVAGSVHPGEDLVIINVYLKLKQDFENLKLIIAPRHNFAATASLLEKQGCNYAKRSQSGGIKLVDADICLLDTIGELSRVYSIASVAFVGGSLVDIGGHNPFEPAAHGVPVVIGKHIATVRDSVEALQKAGALFKVQNESELYQELFELLKNPAQISQAGKAGREVLEQSKGATQKVVEGLKPFLLAQHE